MIPASCAVVNASPFASSRSCRAVSGAMRTSAAATARLRETGLSPTSTMRTAPEGPTCERPVMPEALAPQGGRALERAKLLLEARGQVVLADSRADPLDPAMTRLRVHFERGVERASLPRDVERVDAEGEVAELVVRAGI